MEYIYTSIVFFVSIVEAILFYCVVCRRKMVVVAWKDLFPLVILYLITMSAVAFETGDFLLSVIIIIMYYFAGCIFTQTRKIENIKYWLVSCLLSSVIEQILYELLFKNTFERESGYDIGNVLTCILVSVILIVIDRIYGNRTDQEMQFSSRAFIILIPIVGGIVVCLSYMTYIINEISGGIQKKIGLLVFLFAVAGVCIAIIVLLHTFQQKEYFRLKADMENKYNEQQREYFMLLLDKEKETRRFRHDIVNHLLCIQDAVKHEQCENADGYIADLLSEMDVIRNKRYDLGDEVVNVLLNYYLTQIQDTCSIAIEGYLGRLDTISQMDICTIFSNILKNAVEAIEEKGSIKIDVVRKEKYAEIVIGNSCCKSINLSNKGGLETTKEDKRNHGFGLENVQRVIKKNHGEFCYEMMDNWFEVKVILQIGARSR